MKIYTRTGDKGTTALVGGERVSKAHCRLDAYGTLDELTAHLGYLHDILHGMREERLATQEQLKEIVSRVMDCSAIMASTDLMLEKLPRITDEHIKELEGWLDEYLAPLPNIFKFTLPLGDKALSYTHIVRTVCRRAERCIVICQQSDDVEVDQNVMRYVNRLSDYLYALSRNIAHTNKVEEVLWR